jgi:hypothetical protein
MIQGRRAPLRCALAPGYHLFAPFVDFEAKRLIILTGIAERGGAPGDVECATPFCLFRLTCADVESRATDELVV